MTESILYVAGFITAVLMAATSIGLALKWVRKRWRPIEDFLDDWRGEPARAGVPARPGVPDRIQTIEEDMVEVKHQLFPNSGTSIRDVVDGIRSDVAEVKNDVASVKDDVAGVKEQLEEHIDEHRRNGD